MHTTFNTIQIELSTLNFLFYFDLNNTTIVSILGVRHAWTQMSVSCVDILHCLMVPCIILMYDMNTCDFYRTRKQPIQLVK